MWQRWERLCPKLGIDLSDATLLWSLHLLPIPPVGKVRVIGLDDWSWRRGQRHGTIVVDLERHQVLDLLPDRRSETVKRWLEQHPEIEIVSRDRAIDRDGNLVDSLGSREAGDGGSQAL